MNTERQPGYYRVKYSNKWTFGEYWWSKYHDSFRWSILGIKGSFTDEVFDKDENDKPSIIETPISPSPTNEELQPPKDLKYGEGWCSYCGWRGSLTQSKDHLCLPRKSPPQVTDEEIYQALANHSDHDEEYLALGAEAYIVRPNEVIKAVRDLLTK